MNIFSFSHNVFNFVSALTTSFPDIALFSSYVFKADNSCEKNHIKEMVNIWGNMSERQYSFRLVPDRTERSNYHNFILIPKHHTRKNQQISPGKAFLTYPSFSRKKNSALIIQIIIHIMSVKCTHFEFLFLSAVLHYLPISLIYISTKQTKSSIHPVFIYQNVHHDK